VIYSGVNRNCALKSSFKFDALSCKAEACSSVYRSLMQQPRGCANLFGEALLGSTAHDPTPGTFRPSVNLKSPLAVQPLPNVVSWSVQE